MFWMGGRTCWCSCHSTSSCPRERERGMKRRDPGNEVACHSVSGGYQWAVMSASRVLGVGWGLIFRFGIKCVIKVTKAKGIVRQGPMVINTAGTQESFLRGVYTLTKKRKHYSNIKSYLLHFVIAIMHILILKCIII